MAVTQRKIIEWKSITHVNVPYRVTREEFPLRITYTAWEMATVDRTGLIDKQSHARLHKDGKDTWGAINERCITTEICMLTPRSEERVQAEARFRYQSNLLAVTLISKSGLVTKGEGDMDYTQGQVIVTRLVPVVLKDGSIGYKPSEKADDKVKSMLAMVDFPRLIVMANKNGVPVKDSDKKNPGLLKMRVANAFRKILERGDQIVEA